MKILGYDYELKYSETVHQSDSFGRWDARQQTILIANNLHPQQKTSAILHEILEVLNYHLELNLEHHARMALDAALFQVLNDAGVDLRPICYELEK